MRIRAWARRSERGGRGENPRTRRRQSLAFTLWAVVGIVEGTQLLELQEFHEQVDSRERVSGDHLMGASFIGAGDRVAANTLYVRLPDAVEGTLELQLASIDARYVGSVTYSLSGAGAGWVQAAFPSRHGEVLARYGPDRIAVRAALRGDDAVLPVRWGTGKATEHVVLFVNSERSETFFAVREASGPKKVACERVDSDATIKFDTVCRYPIAAVESRPGFSLHRRRGNSALGRVPVEIGW